MTRFVKIAAGAALVAAIAFSGVARADDEDTVNYREHIMKTMGEQAAAIGQILQQKAPAENFNTHVKVLAITATTALKAFEPKVVGGEAKPEVWAKWADFSKRMNDLVAATADLDKTAQAGGMAAAAPKVMAALTCKGCHDIYREQKKQ